MRLLPLIAIVLAVILLAGCGGDDNNGRVNLVLTESDLGHTFTVDTGSTVSLTLPENPSTGYSWHKSWVPQTSLALLYDIYDPDEPVADGSGGQRRLVFGTQKPGTVVITVQYGQWWDGGTQQEPRTVTLNVVR
ncbi:MAG: protease inhibitor I42 family protein [Armatimonadia bacterium]